MPLAGLKNTVEFNYAVESTIAIHNIIKLYDVELSAKVDYSTGLIEIKFYNK